MMHAAGRGVTNPMSYSPFTSALNDYFVEFLSAEETAEILRDAVVKFLAQRKNDLDVPNSGGARPDVKVESGVESKIVPDGAGSGFSLGIGPVPQGWVPPSQLVPEKEDTPFGACPPRSLFLLARSFHTLLLDCNG